MALGLLLGPRLSCRGRWGGQERPIYNVTKLQAFLRARDGGGGAGAPSHPHSLETCKYPGDPAPSCLSLSNGCSRRPWTVSESLYCKNGEAFPEAGRGRFPRVPFQPGPLPPGRPSPPHSPPHLAQCNTPVPVGSVARVAVAAAPQYPPPQDEHPLNTPPPVIPRSRPPQSLCG